MGKTANICVVEDDTAVCDSLRLMLDRNGYSAETFSSPNDLLMRGRFDRYDCLILDVGLPGMNGLEVLELLRNRSFSKPVILIAAATVPQLESRMRKAGASELLMKPIAPQTLLSALSRALPNSQAALRT